MMTGAAMFGDVAGRLPAGAARAVVGALVAALAVSAPKPSEAARAGAVRTAIQDDADGSYQVDGSFEVQAPRSVVWAVLTDYDGIGGFVKSIRRSAVTAR